MWTKLKSELEIILTKLRWKGRPDVNIQISLGRDHLFLFLLIDKNAYSNKKNLTTPTIEI